MWCILSAFGGGFFCESLGEGGLERGEGRRKMGHCKSMIKITFFVGGIKRMKNNEARIFFRFSGWVAFLGLGDDLTRHRHHHRHAVSL